MATEIPGTVETELTGLELIVSRMGRDAKAKLDQAVLLAMSATQTLRDARGAGASDNVKSLFEEAEAGCWDGVRHLLQLACSTQLRTNEIDAYRKRF